MTEQLSVQTEEIPVLATVYAGEVVSRGADDMPTRIRYHHVARAQLEDLFRVIYDNGFRVSNVLSEPKGWTVTADKDWRS